MFDPTKFTTTAAKPLPVVLLLDVSASMSGGKIDALNQAVREMIASFSDAEQMDTEISVSVISFGGEAALELPFTPSSRIEWMDLEANGYTPMGGALQIAKAMIEDREQTPSRAYRPTIVLVSDGQPNDSWQGPLHDFISGGRSSKCDRMAMAIGKDADKQVLRQFIAGTEHGLFEASNASQLRDFFQHVTMSVTMRSRSTNPNLVPAEAHVAEELKQQSEQPDDDDW